MHLPISHVQTNNIVDYSGKRIAGITQYIRLVIRVMPSLSVETVFVALDKIHTIQWSRDGRFILANVPTQGVVHIWSIQDPNWFCRISAGSGGMSDALWHPVKPGNILVYSDFNLKMDVWSISNESHRTLMGVKNNFVPVVSNNGKHCLMLTRQHCQDVVYFIDMTVADDFGFSFYHSSILTGAIDIVGICWSNNDSYIIAWESPMNPFVYLFDIEGTMLKKVDLYVESPQFRQLGIRTVQYSPHFLALGCYDCSIRVFSIKEGLFFLGVLNCYGDKVLVMNDLPTVWRENLGGRASDPDRNVFTLGGSNPEGFPIEYQQIKLRGNTVPGLGYVELPKMSIPVAAVHLTGTAAIAAGLPTAGISQMAISPDGRFLASTCDCTPSVVRIFDITKMTIYCVLLHRQPVRDFQWNPARIGLPNQLGIVTGDITLFLWTPMNENKTIQMKELSFKPVQIQWANCGVYVLLSDTDRICKIDISTEICHIGG